MASGGLKVKPSDFRLEISTVELINCRSGFPRAYDGFSSVNLWEGTS